MLLISIIWLILIGSEREQGREIKKEKDWQYRIMKIILLWTFLLSFNNLLYNFQDFSLYNNYFQYSFYGNIIEIISYGIIFILIRNKYNNFLKYLSILGIILLLYVNDLIGFYISLEFQSLIFYILASRDSISSGLKYFVYGSLSSALIILGIFLIYNNTGITDINFISHYHDNIPNFSFMLIILGLLIKLGVAPFHFWNIDLLDNSHFDLTAWFTTVGKIGIYFILRLIGNNDIDISIYILLSLLIGTYYALIQNKIKRILAYSGLFQTGFILLGIQSIWLNNNWNGINSIILYIIQYFISFIVIFIIFYHLDVRYIQDIKLNIYIIIIFVIHLFSFAGFPPFIGFFAKFFILNSIISKAFILTILTMIISVISFFIYFNFLSYITVQNNKIINSYSDSWIISFFTFSFITGIISFFLF